MPYRIDVANPPEDALDRFVALGALDVDVVDGGIAAILPDTVSQSSVAGVLGVEVRTTPARGRDDESVWVVQPREVHIGPLQIIPADMPPRAGALRMVDGAAFGTGLHATTMLCLEALLDQVNAFRPEAALDVGTGSGILALAALHAGVPRVVAVDIAADAVRVAADNARLNGLASRLALVHGGAEALCGAWPLVMANVLAAPLIEMAPTLARRVARGGRIVLSGIRSSLARDVDDAYRRVGMRHVRAEGRDGWTALVLHVCDSAAEGGLGRRVVHPAGKRRVHSSPVLGKYR